MPFSARVSIYPHRSCGLRVMSLVSVLDAVMDDSIFAGVGPVNHDVFVICGLYNLELFTALISTKKKCAT